MLLTMHTVIVNQQWFEIREVSLRMDQIWKQKVKKYFGNGKLLLVVR